MWVADKLPVEILVEELNMATVEGKVGLLGDGDLFKSLQIVRALGVEFGEGLVISSIWVDKGADELGHLGLAQVDADIGAPDDN